MSQTKPAILLLASIEPFDKLSHADDRNRQRYRRICGQEGMGSSRATSFDFAFEVNQEGGVKQHQLSRQCELA
ncbi:MAG: hypothetical protein EXS31_14065 [Pedosphaera sp.]|nr:hypothetical protein [Pedosphaera sp.]